MPGDGCARVGYLSQEAAGRRRHRRLQTMGQKAPWLEPGGEWPYQLALSVEDAYTTNLDSQQEPPSVHLVVDHLIWCPQRRRKVDARCWEGRCMPVGSRASMRERTNTMGRSSGWQSSPIRSTCSSVPTCQSRHAACGESPADPRPQRAGLATRVPAPAQAAVPVDALVLSEHGR